MTQRPFKLSADELRAAVDRIRSEDPSTRSGDGTLARFQGVLAQIASRALSVDADAGARTERATNLYNNTLGYTFFVPATTRDEMMEHTILDMYSPSRVQAMLATLETYLDETADVRSETFYNYVIAEVGLMLDDARDVVMAAKALHPDLDLPMPDMRLEVMRQELVLEQTRDALDRSQSLHTAVAATERRVDDKAEAVSELITPVADSTLSADFQKHASVENSKAVQWTGASIGTTLLTAALGATLVIGERPDQVAQQFAELTVTVPLFGLSLYMGRLAAHHRREASWFAARATQLRTLKAFTEALSDTSRNDLRADFGRLVFSAHLLEPAKTEPPSAMDEAVALLERIMGVAKNAVDVTKASRPG